MPTLVTLAQLMVDTRDRADMLPQNYVPTAPGGGGTVLIITANYTANPGDIILANAAAGGFTITIPPSLLNAASQITIKKIDATANAVVIAASGLDLIEGASTQSLITQYDAVDLYADGISNWYVL